MLHTALTAVAGPLLVQVAVQVIGVPSVACVGVHVIVLTMSAPCTMIVAVAVSQAAASGDAFAGVAQIRYGTLYVPTTARAGTFTVPSAATTSAVGAAVQPVQLTTPFPLTVTLPTPVLTAIVPPTKSLPNKLTVCAAWLRITDGASLTASPNPRRRQPCFQS